MSDQTIRSYDFEHEAQRVIDAIEPQRGAKMTVICALHEAYAAGAAALRSQPQQEQTIPFCVNDTCLYSCADDECKKAVEKGMPWPPPQAALRSPSEENDHFCIRCHHTFAVQPGEGYEYCGDCHRAALRSQSEQEKRARRSVAPAQAAPTTETGSDIEIRSALGLTTPLDTIERLRSIRANSDAWPHLLASQQWAVIDAIDALGGLAEAVGDIKILRQGASNIESTENEGHLMWLWRGKNIAYETVLGRLKRIGTGNQATQEHALELGAQRKNTDAQIDDPSLRVVPRAPQDQQEENDHTRHVEPQPGSSTADPRGDD